MKATNHTIGRAAAAAVLAVLLTACGKSVTVSGGGAEGDALPAEKRLIFTVEQVLPGYVRDRANWTPTAAERRGAHREYTDLVSVAERQLIDPAKVAAAAGLRPSFAQDRASYTRSAPYTRVSPDTSARTWRWNPAFWKESATDTGAEAAKRLVTYWADSGVSQSSRGASGNVHDRVHVEIGALAPGLGNKLFTRAELRYAGNPFAPGALTNWSVGNTPPADAYGSWYGSSYRLPASWRGADGERAREFSQSIPGGTLQLIVRTDRANYDDTDWLATGMWWARTTIAPYTAFGVFADGGDPFDRNDIRSLTGTATYTGVAHGVFSHGYAALDQRTNLFRDVNLLFTGDATLTADFGSDRGNGSVSGSISNMKSGSAPGAAHILPGYPTIALGEAALSGFQVLPGVRESRAKFDGAASLTYAGQSYSGSWGGQFFGNAASGATGANAHPSSAAGTFGVTAGVGSSFVGTFEVHR